MPPFKFAKMVESIPAREGPGEVAEVPAREVDTPISLEAPNS